MSVSRFSGYLVHSSDNAFFVSDDRELSVIKWNAIEQQFTFVSDSLCVQRYVECHLNGDFVDHESLDGRLDVSLRGCAVTRCYALFGVQSFGSSSLVLFVSERQFVSSLPLSDVHNIFLVKQLSCLRLPSCSSCVPVDPVVSDASKNGDYTGAADVLLSPSSNNLSEEISVQYCAVIEKFCALSQEHSGGSYFYYSPSVNLAHEPGMVVSETSELFSSFPNDDSMLSWRGLNGCGSAQSTCCAEDIFQWNLPLLNAFVNVEFPGHCKSRRYAPAFIRGAVVLSPAPSDGVRLLLINRLCYRWSGTRYNRRGLDSSGSGATANFSVSTLWVFPEDAQDQSASVRRVAAFSILRGSVPRRWQQPANLRLVPAITISPPAFAVDELSSHLNFIVSLFDGITSLHCLDTSSLSKTELPLSKTFETAVTKLREGGWASLRVIPVHYTKYNVMDRLSKSVSYDAMRDEVNSLVSIDTEDCVDPVDFWQFCCGPVRADCDKESHNVLDRVESVPCEITHSQRHYIRVNCLDCLDRTNVVQSMIAIGVLPQMIRYVCCSGVNEPTDATKNDIVKHNKEDLKKEFTDSEKNCRWMWVQQGIALSQLYAGSEPHFAHFILSGTRSALPLAKIKIALQRWCQQNFYDGEKQDAISLLTCQHDPTLFHTQFESPFSRHLSSLNWMVVSGLAVAAIGVVVNLVLLLAPKYWMRSEILFCEIMWGMYMALLISRIMKDGISYTNYPLLK